MDKLQYASTGPWEIKAQLKGASCELDFCEVAGKQVKKHASDLSLLSCRAHSIPPS